MPRMMEALASAMVAFGMERVAAGSGVNRPDRRITDGMSAWFDDISHGQN